ncbi:MAG: YgfZ/GcvT domain-containing protein [Actinomycetota bacterium]
MTDPAPEVLTARVTRDLVVVEGADAGSFLQSLLSHDLASLTVGEARAALLLQPRGKLLVDLVALRRGDDEWWCSCESGFGEMLAEGLRRFRIRVKAEIGTRAVAGLAIRGLGVAEVRRRGIDDGLAAFPVSWGGQAAVDLLGEAEAVERAIVGLGSTPVDADAYERARIEAGVPRLGADIDEDTIPQEAGLDRDAVSFTKGCFVGQELVCRIDSRGHVNRLLRRLRGGRPETGATVTFEGRDVGRVTSAIGDIGLAMLRREIEPGSLVDVGGTGSRVEAC